MKPFLTRALAMIAIHLFYLLVLWALGNNCGFIGADEFRRSFD
jgi:hypothetical protein